MANKRIFYAVQQAAFTKCGIEAYSSPDDKAVHGLQSLGINTKFNLEQVFEIGQISIYQNIENIPDVEITMEKVLDGYPLIYHLATHGATVPSLSGRANVKATVGLSIFNDTQDSASGTTIAQCQMSGVYVSSLAYNIQVQGNATEQVTIVGNNKVWNNAFTTTSFDNDDAPLATEGVNRRQHIKFGASDPAGPVNSHLPQDIPGITSSGTNELTNGEFGAHVQSIKVSANLGREQLFELGRKGPFHRYVNFPVEVRCDIEVLSTAGDQVSALEEASNLTDRKIFIWMTEGTKLDLGTKSKLASVNYGGANAGQNGGNATVTYSYVTFNDLTVTHPEDPSAL